MNVNETFRRNLMAAREARGLDARNLSLQAGLGERAVKDIEEGRSQSPKISTVFALAKVLGLDPGELLGIGRRPMLQADLLQFLEKFDKQQQEQILSALSNLPLLPR
jgi:transcriptional regulator with XRE-family HTH domain